MEKIIPVQAADNRADNNQTQRRRAAPHHAERFRYAFRQNESGAIRGHNAYADKNRNNARMKQDLPPVDVLFLVCVQRQAVRPHQNALRQHADRREQQTRRSVKTLRDGHADKTRIRHHRGVLRANLLTISPRSVKKPVQDTVQALHPDGNHEHLACRNEDLGRQLHLEQGNDRAWQHDIHNKIRQLRNRLRAQHSLFSIQIPIPSKHKISSSKSSMFSFLSPM